MVCYVSQSLLTSRDKYFVVFQPSGKTEPGSAFRAGVGKGVLCWVWENRWEHQPCCAQSWGPAGIFLLCSGAGAPLQGVCCADTAVQVVLFRCCSDDDVLVLFRWCCSGVIQVLFRWFCSDGSGQVVLLNRLFACQCRACPPVSGVLPVLLSSTSWRAGAGLSQFYFRCPWESHIHQASFFHKQAVTHDWYYSLNWEEMSFTSFWRPTCPPLCLSCCPGFLSGSPWTQCLPEPALVSSFLRNGEDFSRLVLKARWYFSWATCSGMDGQLASCCSVGQSWAGEGEMLW